MVTKIKFKLIIVLFGTIILYNYAHATTLIMSERQGPAGSTVQVTVSINGADSVAGGEFIIQYDPACLEFMGLDSAGFTSNFLVVMKQKDNQIAISMARAEAIGKQYAVILGINFRIRKSMSIGEATEITWKGSRLYSASTALIPHEMEHGVIKVKDISIYPNPFTPNDDGINDVANFLLPDSLMGNTIVKIFGVTGNIVKEISTNETTIMNWNGFDQDGRLVRPGVYLYLIMVNGEPFKKGTITVMR